MFKKIIIISALSVGLITVPTVSAETSEAPDFGFCVSLFSGGDHSDMSRREFRQAKKACKQEYKGVQSVGNLDESKCEKIARKIERGKENERRLTRNAACAIIFPSDVDESGFDLDGSDEDVVVEGIDVDTGEEGGSGGGIVLLDENGNPVESLGGDQEEEEGEDPETITIDVNLGGGGSEPFTIDLSGGEESGFTIINGSDL